MYQRFNSDPAFCLSPLYLKFVWKCGMLFLFHLQVLLFLSNDVDIYLSYLSDDNISFFLSTLLKMIPISFYYHLCENLSDFIFIFIEGSWTHLLYPVIFSLWLMELFDGFRSFYIGFCLSILTSENLSLSFSVV